MNILWENVAREFEPDGALRDIYVSLATVADWQKVLDFIRQHGSDPNFCIDALPAAMPPSVEDLFAIKGHFSICLTFCVGSIHLATHFFAEDEIEFDYTPKDVCGQQGLDSLLEFTKQIGDLLAKPVRLTPENCFDMPFLIYEPISQAFTFIPSAFAEAKV